MLLTEATLMPNATSATHIEPATTIENRQRPGRQAEVRIRAVTGFDRRQGAFPGCFAEQCREALRNGADILAGEGLGMQDVVRVTYIVRDPDGFPACFGMLRDAFGEARPAATWRLVSRFERADMHIELELVARRAA